MFPKKDVEEITQSDNTIHHFFSSPLTLRAVDSIFISYLSSSWVIIKALSCHERKIIKMRFESRWTVTRRDWDRKIAVNENWTTSKRVFQVACSRWVRSRQAFCTFDDQIHAQRALERISSLELISDRKLSFWWNEFALVLTFDAARNARDEFSPWRLFSLEPALLWIPDHNDQNQIACW